MARFAYRAAGLLMIVTILAVFLGLESGCGNQNQSRPEPQTVKIGVVYQTTGTGGITSEENRNGIDLAVEIINQSVEIGLPLGPGEGLQNHNNIKVEVLYRDDQGDPERAAQLVQELVEKDKVVAIVGCYQSSVTAAASEKAEVLQIPFINFESSAPRLTQRGLKWFFRTVPDDSIYVQNFYSFLGEMESEGKSVPRNLTLVYENSMWGSGVYREERRLAEQNGYSVSGDVPYDARAIDYAEPLNKIQASIPGIIMQSSYEDDAIAFIKGYKQKNINPTAILAMDSGFTSPSFLQALGPDGNYIFSREVWAIGLISRIKLAQEVNQLYRQKYNQDMAGDSACSFTGMMVLGEALNRAASFSPEEIRSALLATDIPASQLIMPWKGVRFDASTGQNILGQGLIVQIQDQKYVAVWPRDQASAEAIWPMPGWGAR